MYTVSNNSIEIVGCCKYDLYTFGLHEKHGCSINSVMEYDYINYDSKHHEKKNSINSWVC